LGLKQVDAFTYCKESQDEIERVDQKDESTLGIRKRLGHDIEKQTGLQPQQRKSSIKEQFRFEVLVAINRCENKNHG